MKDLFVPYELAVKLKEKGFQDDCLAYYTEYHKEFNLCHPMSNNEADETSSFISAPLWQQAIDWLREEKKIHIVIGNWYVTPDNFYGVRICRTNEDNEEGMNYEFRSYYSALQSGIEKALEFIDDIKNIPPVDEVIDGSRI